MTIQEAQEALAKHQQVFTNVLDYGKQLYIESITTTVSCSKPKEASRVVHHANLSDGTQVNIAILHTQCPGQLEYNLEDDAVSKIIFRTKRYGDHTTPKQAQECIDAYEQRIEELTHQCNLYDSTFKGIWKATEDSLHVLRGKNAELKNLKEEMRKQLNSPTPPKKELRLNEEQIERCKKIFEDDTIGVASFMKKFREQLNKAYTHAEENAKEEPKFHKGDYVMGEHCTPEGEKATYIGIVDEVHTDNVFFEAIQVTPQNGNKIQLLIGCKAYDNNTIIFNSKHKTVMVGPHGVYIEKDRLKTIKPATHDNINRFDRSLEIFGFKYEDFKMLNNQWTGIIIP